MVIGMTYSSQRRRELLAITAIIAAFCLSHLPLLSAPPNGFHRWRESDTATVAENFTLEGMHFLEPSVDMRGKGPGIVGTELPIYNYATALAYQAFGFSHVWPRLLSLIGAAIAIVAFWRIFRRLAPDRPRAALIATGIAASSPLLYYYGVKIQPDAWGLALVALGFLAFLRWRERGRGLDAVLCALALALAGGIKPTFLFVGLPMAGLLVAGSPDARTALRRLLSPVTIALAVAIIAPIVAWFRHANALTERFGWAYFYLGGTPLAELGGLLRPRFYSNTLLTWPWEMALGVPATAAFVFALAKARERVPGLRTIALWIAGCFVVFIAAAGHCSTPHDYYYMPIIPALAYVAGCGADAMLADRRRGVAAAAAFALVAVPIYGVTRVEGRFEPGPPFAAIRAEAAAAMPQEALVIALDETPGVLLYTTGRRGWQLQPDASLEDVLATSAEGAAYLLVARRDAERMAPTLRARLPAPRMLADAVAVYSLAAIGTPPDVANRN
jgi:4-amino-4-deoxy-L-arabinose transferase-like glycosyltransferase